MPLEPELKPLEPDLQPDPQQAPPSDHSLWLGQVRASLRPFHLDPVEIREVLLAAASVGLDPVDLYLTATRDREPAYDPAPPLNKVLPEGVLKEFLQADEEKAEENRESGAYQQDNPQSNLPSLLPPQA